MRNGEYYCSYLKDKKTYTMIGPSNISGATYGKSSTRTHASNSQGLALVIIKVLLTSFGAKMPDLYPTTYFEGIMRAEVFLSLIKY